MDTAFLCLDLNADALSGNSVTSETYDRNDGKKGREGRIKQLGERLG